MAPGDYPAPQSLHTGERHVPSALRSVSLVQAAPAGQLQAPR